MRIALELEDERWYAESRVWHLATFPRTNTGNPYIDLCCRALQVHGVEHAGGLECTTKWLKANRGRIDAVHFHWPERIWRGHPRGRLEMAGRLATGAGVRGVLRLGRFLRQAGLEGVKRIWTVHNLGHHEGATRIDRWGFSTLAQECDLLIAHSEWAAGEVRRNYPESRDVVVMRHGTFTGAYPQPRAGEVVRREFGVRCDRPVVFFCGILRRYKGIEVACEAARRLGEQVQLVVAGRPKPSRDRGYWREAVGRVPGAVLIDRGLDDQEFADLISASDVVLQSYTRITGSGLLFAAWTFGTGVVASDLPFFREMLRDHPDAGLLFPTGDGAALATRIEEYLAIPEHRRREGVSAAAAAHSWERCIEPVADVFRQWRESER